MSKRLEEELKAIDSLNPDIFTDEEKEEMRRQIRRREKLIVNKEQVERVVEGKEKRSMHVKDMYGQIIERGDYINYPYTGSAGAEIRTGKVVRINKTTDHLDREAESLTVAALVDGEVKKLTVRRTNKCTVIPKLYIQNTPNFYKLITLEV